MIMKTIRQNVMTAIVVFVSLFWIGCEDKQPQSRVEVNTFLVVAEKDTVPCAVNVIYSTTSTGYNKILFIHEGAFLDQEYEKQRDSTEHISMSTEEISRTDTLELFYNEEGKYHIILEVKDNLFSKEITLYSSK